MKWGLQICTALEVYMELNLDLMVVIEVLVLQLAGRPHPEGASRSTVLYVIDY